MLSDANDGVNVVLVYSSDSGDITADDVDFTSLNARKRHTSSLTMDSNKANTYLSKRDAGII